MIAAIQLTRRTRLLAALILAGLTLLLTGCAWGLVTDSQTGQPVPGAQITFHDSQGGSASAFAGGGGLYAFDLTKGQPIPAKGTVNYEVAAPGYEPLTVQREVAYNDNASGASPVQNFSLVPVAAATPTPLEFSGRGQHATQLFPLSEGLVIFHMTHTGEHNFAIWLLDDKGGRIDLLVNEIGSFNGSTAIGVPAGTYLLDISADGAWTVSIEQPHTVTAPPAPQTFTGQGQ